MKKREFRLVVAVWFVVIAAGCSGPPRSQAAPSPAERPAPANPSQTALVNLVKMCAPAAVDMTGYSPNPGGYFEIGVGSGAIIHEDGYILTVNHVAKDHLGIAPDAFLWSGEKYPYRIIMRLGDDLAVVKTDAGKPLPALKLGRSNDLMLGEPLLVIGNPNGLNHSVSNGIVSGVNRRGSGVFIPGMIQVCAAVNAGNSGGPVVNANGELVGVIQSKMEDVENIAFALSVDHVRKLCAERMSPETWGVWLGMAVDPYGAAKVTSVVAQSPAEKAGVRVGDVVRRVGTMRTGDGVDFYLGLPGKKVGDVLTLEVARRGATLPLAVTLEPIPMRAAENVSGLVAGLNYAAYQGTWDKLPDFSKLTPVEFGRADKFPPANCRSAANPFALKFTGYVLVPADGAYTFYVASDDGSRLWIGDKLVVDNDGLHGSVEKSGSIALKAGKHPVTLTYFDAGGGKWLAVSYEGPNLAKQAIPPTALFGKP